MVTGILATVIVLNVLTIWLTTLSVGRPKESNTPAVAAMTFVINGSVIAGLVYVMTTL